MTQPTPNFTPVAVRWESYDVPALWAMVESEQDWANREQVGAWMRMHDMLVSHQENLQRIRAGIVDRWPPEGSPTARAFIARLDGLIGSAQEASQAARSNASALNLLTDALLDARSGIESLHFAWQSATPQQQARLNQQARALMAQADARVIEHGNQFTPPPDVTPPSNESWQPDPVLSQPPPASGSRGIILSMDSSQGLEVAAANRLAPTRSESDTMVPIQATDQGLPPTLAGLPPTAPQPPGLQTASRQSARATSHSIPSLQVGGVLALPSAVAGRALGWLDRPGRLPSTGTGAAAVEGPGRAVAPVHAGGGSLSSVPARAEEGEPAPNGFVGGGLGAASMRPAGNRRNQYPDQEEWQIPRGVQPVLQPSPAPDPKTAFDPGPNVIGGRRCAASAKAPSWQQ